MKLPQWTRALDPLGWLLSALAVAGVVFAFWWFVFAKPAADRRAAQEAKIEAGLSAARTDSAKDAIGAAEDDHASQAETDQKVHDAIEAIRSSPDPDNAALRELCGFKSAARLPECVQ